jgi:hypothetical protein
MHNAAGGTSQRLNPACAMMRSRSSNPGAAPTRPPAASMVVMRFLRWLLRARGAIAVATKVVIEGDDAVGLGARRIQQVSNHGNGGRWNAAESRLLVEM